MNRIGRRILKHLKGIRTLAGEPLPENFVMPSYDGYGLVNVPATLLAHFGVKRVSTPPLAPEVLGEGLKGARKVVVLVVDALGFLDLQTQMQADRSLGFHDLARGGTFVPLTSIFPSTTAACLSSLHTALPPVGHAITGYRMFFPERGFIGNMIRLSPETDERPNRLLQQKGDARALLGVSTVHRRLARVGVASYCLIQNTIAGSGLSEMLYDGATVVPFVNSTDLFVQIRKILAEDPGKPACIWAYWGLLDTIQHQYGTWSEEAEAEVRNLGYSLKRELLAPRQQSGKGKACLMVLADHGHIQVDATDVIDLRRLGKLEDFLGSPPAGTGRSAYLHLRSGESRKAQEYFKKALGGRALVVGSQKLLKEGLWGPGKVRPEFAGRVGDLVVVPVGNRGLFYPYWPGSKVQDVVGGRHGGLHEEEMLIPFFCAPV